MIITAFSLHVNRRHHSREGHIITLEDPLEYMHRHDKCIVSQREICTDTQSYLVSLRATLRQSPDVILLGEMRDYETINVAMTAAETGHLLFSTLHTIGAANTIDRIIDVFPPNQQHQIAVQLSMVLNAVVSQQLIPTVDGGVAPAFEIMTVTPAIRNMIRDNKIPQIDGILYSSAKPDMISMDNSLLALYKSGNRLDLCNQSGYAYEKTVIFFHNTKKRNVTALYIRRNHWDEPIRYDEILQSLEYLYCKPSKIPKIYCRRFPQRRTGRRFCDRNADYYPER